MIRPPVHTPGLNNKKWQLHGLVISILLLTLWSRLWRLSDVPPGMWFDEAYNGMDAAWIWNTLDPQIYFINNSGREPLFHHIGAVVMGLIGVHPYTFRLVSVFSGLLTIALLYRWVLTLFADNQDRRWLALIAATGLCCSSWYLTMNRMGFRTNLVPLFTLLVVYFFWLGWGKQSNLYFLWGGVALGFSQYTYISARVLPFLIIGFVLAYVTLNIISHWAARISSQKTGENINLLASTAPLVSCRGVLWPGFAIMLFIAVLIFLPLGLFFLNHPGTYLERVTVLLDNRLNNEATFPDHLARTFRLFIDGFDDNWRHNLVGVPAFSWLEQIGFWVGFLITIKHFQRPASLFLLISGLVLWAPALLSSEPVHAIRLSGWLPIYYTFMALGLVSILRFVTPRLTQLRTSQWLNLAPLLLVLFVNGGRTGYNYFFVWANKPDVYFAYDGPISDLTQNIIDRSTKSDLLIPFQLYTHPTARILLHERFREVDQPPVFSDRPVTVVTLPDPTLVVRLTRTQDQAYVWLTYDQQGQGIAYVSRQELKETHLSMLQPVDTATAFPYGPTTETFAWLTPVADLKPVSSQLTDWNSLEHVNVDWGHQFKLAAFQPLSKFIQPGQTLPLNLYWRGPLAQPWPYQLKFYVTDAQGTFFGQWQPDAFPTELFRWRNSDLIRAKYQIFISPEALPGPYLIWAELLDPKGDNVLAYSAEKKALGNRVFLGLFYVGQNDNDPRIPPTSLSKQFSDNIELIGYEPPVPLDGNLFRGKLFWRTSGHVGSDYITVVQLLNGEKQVISSWASPPLAGQYPTKNWRSDEIVVDQFDLDLPPNLSAGTYRLVAGMRDPKTGEYLSLQDQSQLDDFVILTEVTLR